MLQITAIAPQSVVSLQNVKFTAIAIPSTQSSITYTNSNSVVKLRGLVKCPCQYAKFRVHFNGNMGVAGATTASTAQLAIAVDGEEVTPTHMEVVVGTATQYYNVGADTIVYVPAGCCSTLTVKNVGTTEINLKDANLIVERIA